MSQSRLFAIEFVAQVALAAAIGLFVSIVLAAAALLLADSADTSSALPEVPVAAPAART